VAETAVRTADTRALILDAARIRLLADGYGGLSTRKVADEAGVPLSQLHYHFGSKQGLILAVLEVENQRRLARQQNIRRGRATVAALRAGLRLFEDDLTPPTCACCRK
jgi:AcrR family transcriptional regulator